MLWKVWPWAYDPAWRAVVVLLVLCRGAVVLQAYKPRWWVAVPALMVHCWAARYPQRWVTSWLEAEIHAVAFCCLLFGLALLAEIPGAGLHGSRSSERSAYHIPITLPLLQAGYARWVPRSMFDSRESSRPARKLVLAALFLGTAAAYYPTPWHPEIRAWLMWWQSGCYLALALPSSIGI